MPHLPYSIELHDSWLAYITQDSSGATIALSPAYIHRGGKGWRQNAEIVVAGALVEGFRYELPARISDGNLKAPGGPYHNLLMLPLASAGPVRLELELESGEVVLVKGESVEVRLLGEATFVEDVA